MKTGQLIDMLREYADNIEENYGRDKEFDWSPNTYMLGAPFLGTYDGYVNLKNPVSEDDDDEYYESKKKSSSQVKKEAKIKIPVKSFRESNWGQYSSDNCWDEYDILMNYDAVDFCEMCNSSEGSAIADQLCDILTGEEELKEQNPNALEYIKQFCERKGEVDLADAIAKYLEDEDQDGTLDEFMESKKNSNKFVEKTYPVTLEEYAVNLNKDWGSDYFTPDMDVTKWKYDKACYVYDYMKKNPWDNIKFKIDKPEDAFKINWDI